MQRDMHLARRLRYGTTRGQDEVERVGLERKPMDTAARLLLGKTQLRRPRSGSE
jgi:hypothetical protein